MTDNSGTEGDDPGAQDVIDRFLPLPFFLWLILAAGPASACLVPPAAEQTERALRATVEQADHVIIARVSHVLRRRWTSDDTMPDFHQRMFDYVGKHRSGEYGNQFQYFANWVEFAEATAYLEIETELYWTGLSDGQSSFADAADPDLLPIDLLRPFTVSGHGPCHDFPTTCPWDIWPGELVAVAIEEQRFGAHRALVCSRIPRLTLDQRRKIEEANRTTTKFDALLPHLAQFEWLRDWRARN